MHGRQRIYRHKYGGGKKALGRGSTPWSEVQVKRGGGKGKTRAGFGPEVVKGLRG
jgi:hypothetical protein